MQIHVRFLKVELVKKNPNFKGSYARPWIRACILTDYTKLMFSERSYGHLMLFNLFPNPFAVKKCICLAKRNVFKANSLLFNYIFRRKEAA